MLKPTGAAAANLIAGTATRYFVLFLTIGTGIVLMPFTVRHLGQTDYGLWMLVASMTTYFQLLDLGYGNGIVRHLVDADRRGDIDDVNRIASTFVWVYTIIALVACAGLGTIALTVVPRFPHLSPAQLRMAQALLAILGVRVAVGFPLTVFGAVTNARQGFALNNMVASANVVANAVCTYVVLESGGGLLTLVATTTVASIAGYGGYAWSAYRVMPGLQLRPRYFSSLRWREVTNFSLYLFVINIAGQISFNIDNIVVGAWLGPAFVAVYSIALRLSEYQRRLCDQFSGMLFPVAMAFGADGDRHALKRTLIEGNRIALVLVTGASVCLIGFSGPLIRGWMGPAFGGSVAPFIVLALAGAIVVSQAASPNVLIALGSHRLVTCVWIGEAAINLMLSVVLVRTMGLVGVAVGTLVPLIVGHLFVMQTAACRKVGVPITSYAYQTGRGAAIAGAVATCACAALRLMYPPASAVTVIAEGALVGSVYIVSLATIGFDRETRSSYGSLIASVFRGLSSALAVKGNRATKVDPEEPLSASVSVP